MVEFTRRNIRPGGHLWACSEPRERERQKLAGRHREANRHKVIDHKRLRIKDVGNGLDLFFGIGVVTRNLLGQTIGQFGKIELWQVVLNTIFGQGESVRFRIGLGGRGQAGGHFDGNLGGLTAKIDGLQLDAVGLGRAAGRLGWATSGGGRALGRLG